MTATPPPQPPMFPPGGAPSAGPGGYPGPLRVRYNPVFGAISIVIGVLNLVLAVVNDYPIGWFPGLAFTVVGVFYCVGTVAEIDQQTVRVKSPVQITVKTVPIHGIGDLLFEGKTLFRAGDHRKIVNLGWGSAHSEDLQRLQAAVARAHTGSPAPFSTPPAQFGPPPPQFGSPPPSQW